MGDTTTKNGAHIMDANAPPETGCIVDGHSGHYAGALLIDFARTYGFPDQEAIGLADRKLLAMMRPASAELSDEEEETLADAADEAIEWLNENVAQEGRSFGWHEGEIFYQSEEWWAE